jgi:hypothetical protein
MASPSGGLSLRNTVATLAYRAEKVLRDPPPDFAAFRASPRSRSALALVGHLGDLIEWAERLARGDRKWSAVPQTSWDVATDRYFRALETLDATLAGLGDGSAHDDVVFQAPIADARTHVGQLALMRGLAGAPVRPESYVRARIVAGTVGRDQPPERVEFDGDASPPAGG